MNGMYMNFFLQKHYHISKFKSLKLLQLILSMWPRNHNCRVLRAKVNGGNHQALQTIACTPA